MSLQDLIRDVCPVCHRETTLAVIEPHPARTGLKIYTFNCDVCGPTKSKVVETPLVARAQSIRSKVGLPSLSGPGG